MKYLRIYDAESDADGTVLSEDWAFDPMRTPPTQNYISLLKVYNDAGNETFDVAKFHVVGDVNQDGIVNNADVSALTNYLTNNVSNYSFDYMCADFNGDGVITRPDVDSLLELLT